MIALVSLGERIAANGWTPRVPLTRVPTAARCSAGGVFVPGIIGRFERLERGDLTT